MAQTDKKQLIKNFIYRVLWQKRVRDYSSKRPNTESLKAEIKVQQLIKVSIHKECYVRNEKKTDQSTHTQSTQAEMSEEILTKISPHRETVTAEMSEKILIKVSLHTETERKTPQNIHMYRALWQK